MGAHACMVRCGCGCFGPVLAFATEASVIECVGEAGAGAGLGWVRACHGRMGICGGEAPAHEQRACVCMYVCKYVYVSMHVRVFVVVGMCVCICV